MRLCWIGFLILVGCLNSIARSASLVDGTFAIGTGADGIVEQVLQQPDGKILICGNFTTFNGQSKAYMARLNNDGSVDTSFTAGPGYWTRHMALQSDGKIVIGGYFTTVEGQKRNRIARLNPNGSLDTTFNVGAGCEGVLGVAIDGNPDPFVMWCEVLPTGRILAVGNFTNYNTTQAYGIIAIKPDGSRDTSFDIGGTGLDSWGRVIKPLANGQIMVGGWFQNYRGKTSNRVVRINADGSPDNSFNAYYGDRTAIYAIVEQANGQLITSGHSLNYDGLFTREVERINVDGSVDPTWPGYTNEKTESLLLLGNGKVVVGGNFTQVNGQPRKGLARFNADGSLDPTFIADTDNYVWTIAPADPGKILVSGGFTTIDGLSRRGVARVRLPEGATGGTNQPPSAPHIMNATVNGKFQCIVGSVSGFNYTLQFKNAANAPTWTALTPVAGTGGPITLTDDAPAAPRFYRVEVR
jgi:uncharacterized delta-60 repeat protein